LTSNKYLLQHAVNKPFADKHSVRRIAQKVSTLLFEHHSVRKVAWQI